MNMGFKNVRVVATCAALCTALCGCADSDRATDSSKRRDSAALPQAMITRCAPAPKDPTIAVTVYDARTDIARLEVVIPSEGRVRRLAVVPNAFSPVWSPDATVLAFTRMGQTTLTLNIKNESLGLYSLSDGRTSLLSGRYVDREPDWNPDATKLAFARFDYLEDAAIERNAKVVVVSASKEGFGRLGPVTDSYSGVDEPKWSPSGGAIAFIGARLEPVTRKDSPAIARDLYLMDARSGKTVRITNTGDVVRYSLDWSPDGRHIAFATGPLAFRTLEAIDVATRVRRVLLRSASLGDKQLRTLSGIDWSPTGGFICFEAFQYDPGAGTSYVGVVDWPQAQWRWLTDDGQSNAPCWESDGKRVIYVRKDTTLYSVRPDGTDATLLVSLAQLRKTR